jgi:hypothetical protein
VILDRKPERNGWLEILRHGWEDLKRDVKIRLNGIDWVHVAQGKDKMWTAVKRN